VPRANALADTPDVVAGGSSSPADMRGPGVAAADPAQVAPDQVNKKSSGGGPFATGTSSLLPSKT